MNQKGSKIFLPNRSLGYVSNHLPLQVRYIDRRKEYFIVTCVGRSFHTYDTSHFSLLSVSNLHESDITCIASDTYHIYTSCDNTIYAWRRGTELKHTYSKHLHPVNLMLPFGPYLISIDEESTLKIWDIKTEEIYSELKFSNEDFKITTILHPNTYINKILLGSEQGALQLWNLGKSKLVYTFKGWNKSVSCLSQAPAIDVVAIGLVNGQIILHNLKYDETIMEFNQDWGVVTSIAFRTDDIPIMATGCLNGTIVFWNLEEKRVVTQLMNAHDSSVTGMVCIPGEPLMVTSSPDNTLKMWIFDMPDGGARLLRIREGHSSPPNFIRFHGMNGHNILSSAPDSTLRIFNTQTERFNKSLGKASFNRKLSKKRKKIDEDSLIMPPIIQFTSEMTREKEWDNIAAIHLGLPTITTWSYDKLKMGDLKVKHERFNFKNLLKQNYVNLNNKQIQATSVCLTHCGNFLICGYNTGHVDRFNIQSGLHRFTYGAKNNQDGVAHKTSVHGVACDTLNKQVITAGLNGIIKFWHFKKPSKTPIGQIHLNDSVNFLRSNCGGPVDSSLICVVLDDGTCQLIDIDMRRVVRQNLGCHNGRITDVAFSPDGRWLITTGVDCIIKIWDIPSGQLIDRFKIETICVSLTFSPTGEYLAMALVEHLGIFLWTNVTLYKHTTLRPITEDVTDDDIVPFVRLPFISAPAELDDIKIEEEFEEYKSPEQISDELITLSGLSTSRWQNLLNLDVIKRRNKPKEPIKVPKSAPFFLPTVSALKFQFDLTNNESHDLVEPTSKILMAKSFLNLSPFCKLLQKTIDTNVFDECIEKMESFGPSVIDNEIKLLSAENSGDLSVMLQFMKMLMCMLKSNKNFELAQAYLAVLLKSHGSVISCNKELSDYLSLLQIEQLKSWNRLQSKLMYSLCQIEQIKNF